MKPMKILLPIAVFTLLLFAVTAYAQFGLDNYDRSGSGWTLGPEAREAVGSSNLMYARMDLRTPDFILWLEDELDLTEEQKEKLVEMRLDDTVKNSENWSRMNVLKRQLSDLLEKDEVDIDQVRKKIKEMEELRSQMILDRIMSSMGGAQVLTDEQRETLKRYNRYQNRGFAPYRKREENYPDIDERIQRRFRDN